MRGVSPSPCNSRLPAIVPAPASSGIAGGTAHRTGVDYIRNEFAQTPLHAACVSGNIEVVRRLVQGGADTNAQDAAEVRRKGACSVVESNKRTTTYSSSCTRYLVCDDTSTRSSDCGSANSGHSRSAARVSGTWYGRSHSSHASSNNNSASNTVAAVAEQSSQRQPTDT